jgi:hypothetical protein
VGTYWVLNKGEDCPLDYSTKTGPLDFILGSGLKPRSKARASGPVKTNSLLDW